MMDAMTILDDHFFDQVPGQPPAPTGNTPSPLPPPPPASRPRTARLVGAAAACAALSATVSYATVKLTDGNTGGVTYVATAPAASGGNSATLGDLHQLLAKVLPAVVAIEVSTGSGSDVTPVAAGSGVIISNDGLLLTNAHVVQATDATGQQLDNPVFTVKMSDGTVRAATVLGASTDYDVALMQLEDTSGLHPLALANDAQLRVGDAVVAIGNALDLGDSPTVTTGIISALDRTLIESDTVTLHGLIQTDAAINHGNSGGALVNAAGELVGINSAGYSDAQNVGFAISVETIKPILDDLKAGKNVVAAPIGFIGVNVADTPYGLTVTTVQDGTPAEAAGIQAGDVITSVAGTTIATTEQLRSVLLTTAPGTTVTIGLTRDGKPLEMQVTLAERPSAA
jgi:putative serine protease PepD